MSLKDRFEDRTALIDALKAQKIVQGDQAVADALAEAGVLLEFAAGDVLIEQGASDRDVYFLLAGRTRVIVNGSTLYAREKNLSVGEMSAVNPEILRSATIRADETTIAWRVTHEQLEAAAKIAPRLWKLVAMDLSGRLEQRNRLISPPNDRPKVFIISSTEALDIAEAIRVGLDHEAASVEIWSDDQIFPIGSYPLDALSKKVGESDFGIAIAQPDDLVRSRDRQSTAPRDNVIFELGFFMAVLGRERTLLMVPRGEDVKMPSDFKGLTPLEYKTPHGSEKLSTAMGAAVTQIKTALRTQGVRKHFESH